MTNARRTGAGIGLVWAAVVALAFATCAGTAGADPLFGPRPDPDWRAPHAEVPADGKVRVIVFGAHPDDAEIKAGGIGALWAEQGHHVKFVALTNGDVGHWGTAGGPLAQRRTAEVERARDILGIAEVEVLDIHDGELMPTLENRRTVVRLIREWGADIVVVHRTNDYHPDHRNAGLLVRDAAYMVTVPFFCPDVPHLKTNPLFLYMLDGFQRPYPFQPDIVVDIGPVIDKKADAMAAMESQFLEGGCCGQAFIPQSEEERQAGLERVRQSFRSRFAAWADEHRERVIEAYGEERGAQVRYIEAFEIAEHGRRPSDNELRRLFPFPGLWTR